VPRLKHLGSKTAWHLLSLGCRRHGRSPAQSCGAVWRQKMIRSVSRVRCGSMRMLCPTTSCASMKCGMSCAFIIIWCTIMVCPYMHAICRAVCLSCGAQAKCEQCSVESCNIRGIHTSYVVREIHIGISSEQIVYDIESSHPRSSYERSFSSLQRRAHNEDKLFWRHSEL
jgi:hypothetical protein